MVPSSYLRIYQPVNSFRPRERAKWERYIDDGAQLPILNPYRHVAFEEPNSMGLLYPSMADHAFVRKVNGEWFVCPWRTKLRVLVGLLSFRNSLPFEIADAFVPEHAAARAASELEELQHTEPGLLAHITTAAWQVPLRWFLAFDDAERVVTSDKGRLKIRYEAELKVAFERVERGIKLLENSGMAENVVDPIQEMLDWMREFPAASMIELDYGSIGGLFSDEELAMDRSAGEIWSCLEALDSGDFEESGRIYSELASWWGRVRAIESAN